MGSPPHLRWDFDPTRYELKMPIRRFSLPEEDTFDVRECAVTCEGFIPYDIDSVIHRFYGDPYGVRYV